MKDYLLIVKFDDLCAAFYRDIMSKLGIEKHTLDNAKPSILGYISLSTLPQSGHTK